jgi:hypothetical protein
MMTLNDWCNILIVIVGPSASIMSQSKQFRLRKFAPMVAIWGQPAWIYLAWTSNNMGMFAVCFLYTYGWLLGIYNYWIKKTIEA